MPFDAVYAPHPPQFTVSLTLDQLARRDMRFVRSEAVQLRGTLGLLLQDSADLQQAHIALRNGQTEWHGTPGQFDEDGRIDARSPATGWSESTLLAALDLSATALLDLSVQELAAALAGWSVGIVYVFGRPTGSSVPGMTRRLNLANFFDRLEAELLASRHFEGCAAVWAYRLDQGGQVQGWRAEPQRPRRVAASREQEPPLCRIEL
ncbi:hypothetical protein MF271_21165 (plasmid) [Deinococcus sp. KNUC1210]|uniref:hypothetical protein n=1 Tax=Deinococcus sp. KNUC1210 TaxID=2917691 RepID=UPI001EF014C5|nr:hypothetical protein [Deinococcus sp. KNUC1210]ULH17563.1 hypothetical protein MF271_21165 [Deinococcus sp. KNUC1210]